MQTIQNKCLRLAPALSKYIIINDQLLNNQRGRYFSM